MAAYTWLDYIILGVFLLNIVTGFARGLIKEIISSISMLVAFLIAIKFTLPITDFLNSSDGFKSVIQAFSTFTSINAMTPLSLLSLGVSFLVLFVGTYCTGEAISYYASTFGVIMFPGLAFLDRILAAGVGFVRGYAFNLILILILGMTPVSQENAWNQSFLIPQLKPKADWLGGLVRPGGFPMWSGYEGGAPTV